MKKTYMAKKSDITRKWYIVDAKDKILGRLAVKVAWLLMGKNKPEYTPNVEMGDEVIIINAKEIRLSGKKSKIKTYDHFTGYASGRKVYSFEKLMEKKPREILLRAVKGMLPKNKIGRKLLTRLRVYPGTEHYHQAQKPQEIKI